MNRRTLIFSLISLIGIAAFVLPIFWYPNYANLPFYFIPVGSRMVIEPIPELPLPSGLKAGDIRDWQAMTSESRMATEAVGLKAGLTFPIKVLRGGQPLTVPVTSVNLSTLPSVRNQFIGLLIPSFLALLLALITLWRGQDWTAWGLSLTGFTVVLASVIQYSVPSSPYLIFAQLYAWQIITLPLLFGLYLTVDTLAGAALKARLRWIFRSILGVLFGMLAFMNFKGPIDSIFLGISPWWWRLTIWNLIFLAIPVVLLILLVTGYVYSQVSVRLRIRWILASTILIAVGLTIYQLYTSVFDEFLWLIFLALANVGYLYGVLRHRLVDVSFVLNRTLVYGAVTALVVGILAAVNALVEHAALGTSASLLVQVAVPLSLGIVLNRVRVSADRVIERVFFRRKYRAARALRHFARHCIRYTRTDELLTAAAAEIRQQLGAPTVAFYEHRGEGYVCVQSAGEQVYPHEIKMDDAAFVAARDELKVIDLSELNSSLGTDGYAFPMMALGELRGVLVCANRPGEEYDADERKLLSYLAHQMGLALYTLRMQAKSKLVDTLASSPWPPAREIQIKARELAGVPSLI